MGEAAVQIRELGGEAAGPLKLLLQSSGEIRESRRESALSLIAHAVQNREKGVDGFGVRQAALDDDRARRDECVVHSLPCGEGSRGFTPGKTA